jgi:hypothetical protein
MRIGFVVSNPYASYETCQASTRIRVYDVITWFEGYTNVRSEIYVKYRKYDIVVFQKCFGDEYVNLARILKKRGCSIVFDINVNYVELRGKATSYVKAEQTKNVLRMLDVSDVVLVSGARLNEIYREYHNNVITIEEGIDNMFFRYNKEHEDKSVVNLLYCGYAIKADQILLIKNVLDALRPRFRMVYVCDKDPGITLYPYVFYSYDYWNLPKLLKIGDIKIAPRDMSDSYNEGHAFTKVGYPMAVGIPAVASSVPSYCNRGVMICDSENEWYNVLFGLIVSFKERSIKGASGKVIAWNNFSMGVIGNKYLKVFREMGYDTVTYLL